MKKLIAALMSLCLILTAAAALGETAEEAVETEPIVVNWSDYEAAVEDVDGQFAQVSDTGLVMFIPAMFKDTELSDETLEGGTFLVLKSETEENVVVSAQYAAVDIALFKAGLASQGVTLYDVTLVRLRAVGPGALGQPVPGDGRLHSARRVTPALHIEQGGSEP